MSIEPELVDTTEPVTRDLVPPPMPTTCPGCACDMTYRREAERQARMLLERNPNVASVAALFPTAARDADRSASEPMKDFAATLRYAALLATVEMLRREVRRLGGDPERLLAVQP